MDNSRNTPEALRPLFQVRPDIHFLNHGSFGATPRPVQRAASRWRARMERQPVEFLGRELYGLLAAARAEVAPHFGAHPDDLAFVTNATVGVNIAAHSLADRLRPGDEVLATEHEYGACANAWEFVCAERGARYVRQPLPMPDDLPESDDAAETMAEAFLAGVTPRTRVFFLSHITSPTAVRLPIERIIRFAREHNIFTVIDGAHSPGQLDLNLDELGADFYTGNCHKWLCAPKGAGILHVRRAMQECVKPVIVSWGWAPERHYLTGSDFQDALVWGGTTDFSAWLAIPAAIRFQRDHDWSAVHARCADMLTRWLPRFAAAAGMEPVYTARTEALRPPQLAVSPLPEWIDADVFKRRLYDEFRVEAPLTAYRGRQFVRVSVQGYVSESDLGAMEDAIRALIADGRR